MPNLNFPNSPALNQEYTVGVKTWKWNGTAWQLVPLPAASFVDFDDGTVQEVLDAAKPLANYTELRAYTGRATGVRITTSGIAGFFQRTGSAADNGGTVIVDGAGRSWQRLFDGAVSVKWFGAKGDGVTDDTTSIQSAITNHDSVNIPAGVYKTIQTLSLNRTGQNICGEGSSRTEIRLHSTTLTAIALQSGVANYKVSGVKVGRVGGASNGANGVQFLGTTDNAELTDVWCEGHHIGLYIGTCDTGLLQKIRCNKNLSHGIFQTNSTAYGPSQWEAIDILVDRNAADGWRIESASGPAGMILGTMTSIKSFANSGRGLHLIGNSTTPVFDFRLVNGFLGSDGAGSIRMDTYGGKHRISGFFERNGRDPTGPTLAVSASNAAPGIEISSNNIDVGVFGSTIDDNSYDGIQHDGGTLVVSGCVIFNNGQGLTGGRRNGILSNNGRLVVGSSALTNFSGNTTQLFGIATAHDKVIIAGNDLSGNVIDGATLGGAVDAVMIANAPTELLGRLPATTNVLRFNSALTPLATGGDKGAGTINVSSDIFKNNIPY